MRRHVSGVTESRADLLARELVLRLEVLGRSSGGQASKNCRHIDPSSCQAGLPETDFGVH